MVTKLHLPSYGIEADGDCHVTVHANDIGMAKVAFFMNPNREPLTAEATLGFSNRLRDVLTGDVIESRSHRHSVVLPARTVRIFAIE
jgi:hypothetical protein